MRVALTLLILCLGSATVAAQPTPTTRAPAPTNADCLACHEDASAARADGRSVGVLPAAFTASVHGQASLACVDCHADLASVSEFPHAERLATVNCATCHSAERERYADGVHARAREKAGLNVAPACADCHGIHDIRSPSDAASRVNHLKVPVTCGKCHDGIKKVYDIGIHAQALAKGNPRAPACADCHTAHAIQRADTAAWKLAAAAECGSCHDGVVESFRRTFHGKVTELGFTRVATCADCHGAHDILPATDARSRIAPARLVATCARCHPGANDEFVKYDPHPNPHDHARSPLLWWINRFYTVLIAGCFSFFGLHSFLWFLRARKEGHHETGAAS